MAIEQVPRPAAMRTCVGAAGGGAAGTGVGVAGGGAADDGVGAPGVGAAGAGVGAPGGGAAGDGVTQKVTNFQITLRRQTEHSKLRVVCDTDRCIHRA